MDGCMHACSWGGWYLATLRASLSNSRTRMGCIYPRPEWILESNRIDLGFYEPENKQQASNPIQSNRSVNTAIEGWERLVSDQTHHNRIRISSLTTATTATTTTNIFSGWRPLLFRIDGIPRAIDSFLPSWIDGLIRRVDEPRNLRRDTIGVHWYGRTTYRTPRQDMAVVRPQTNQQTPRKHTRPPADPNDGIRRR